MRYRQGGQQCQCHNLCQIRARPSLQEQTETPSFETGELVVTLDQEIHVSEQDLKAPFPGTLESRTS
jgi:hypothetical protein